MSAEHAPAISVVVPTFRRPEALRQTLQALLKLEYPAEKLEVVVVDDEGEGRAQDVIESVDRGEVDVRVERQRRRGAASARNRGASKAAGDLLLFVDDDILVAPDHLARHLDVRRRHGNALVNGAWKFTPEVLDLLSQSPFGRFRIALEQRFQEEASGAPLDGSCVEMEMLGSWDLAVERQVFWNLAGFDEAFPVAGAEDQDFSLRARAAGHRLVLDRGIICLHNDNRVSLEAYCAREERSAKTMPLLARKFPSQFAEAPYITENRPIRRVDPVDLALKKAAKSILSRQISLAVLHRTVRIGEALRLPERLLRRLYATLLGLHLFRGFRSAWEG